MTTYDVLLQYNDPWFHKWTTVEKLQEHIRLMPEDFQDVLQRNQERASMRLQGFYETHGAGTRIAPLATR